MAEIVTLADECNERKSADGIKKAIVKGIPRQALLKPAHALYRLHTQKFSLGDRVIMVQDSGSIPLAIKGVVVGINNKSMDVVWDVPFMSGTTLGDRLVTSAHFTAVSLNFACLDVHSTEDPLLSLIPV